MLGHAAGYLCVQEDEMKQKPPKDDPADTPAPMPARDNPRDNEALLDEAVDETMPASDPVSPAAERDTPTRTQNSDRGGGEGGVGGVAQGVALAMYAIASPLRGIGNRPCTARDWFVRNRWQSQSIPKWGDARALLRVDRGAVALLRRLTAPGSTDDPPGLELA
jgi:hypothetical protein